MSTQGSLATRWAGPGAWARFAGPWTRAHRVRSVAAWVGAVTGVVALAG